MKDINFRVVGFENFCLYRELTEFGFKNGTITLITGPNGSGKSTIFNAINFSLYGVTSTGLRGEEVVNNVIGKDCMVYSSWEVGGDVYLVKRYVKHHKHNDSVFLYKNNELIKKGHREVVPEIESILLPQKLFTNTLFFGQKVKTFFTDLTDSEQKDIFRKVLQLDNYTDYYDFVNAELKSLNNELNSIDNEIIVYEGLIEDYQGQILKSKIDKKEFGEIKLRDKTTSEQKLLSLRQSEILKSECDTDGLENTLKETMGVLNSYVLQYEQIQNKKTIQLKEVGISKAKKESETKESYLTRKNKIESDYQKATSDLTASKESEILVLEKTITELSSKIKNLEKSTSGLKVDKKKLSDEVQSIELHLNIESPVCYVCKQKIGEKEKKELRIVLAGKKSELSTINETIEKEESDLQTFNKNLSLSNKSLKLIRDQINTDKNTLRLVYEKDLKELKSKFDEFSTKINALGIQKSKEVEDKFLSEINETSFKIKEHQDLIDSINARLKALKELKNKKQQLLIDIERILAEIEEIEKREFNEDFLVGLINKDMELRVNLDKHLNKKKDVGMRIKVYEFWKTGFSMSGIPSMLIDEAIPFMNQRIAYYLDQIGSRYLVSFDTINETKSGEYRDKIKINILDTVTKANSRKQLSGGQTRVVDIATIFTLRDLQSRIQDMKINIILLDEIFDSLDEGNISYVSTMLRKMVNDQSINIISHRNIDQIESDEVYRTI